MKKQTFYGMRIPTRDEGPRREFLSGLLPLSTMSPCARCAGIGLQSGPDFVDLTCPHCAGTGYYSWGLDAWLRNNERRGAINHGLRIMFA